MVVVTVLMLIAMYIGHRVQERHKAQAKKSKKLREDREFLLVTLRARIAELESTAMELEKERDQARQTSREMNRRNQELQHTLNIESGRKAWKGYFDACWRVMKDDHDKHQAIRARNIELEAENARLSTRVNELVCMVSSSH
jgi:lipid A disaccharide synthetase